MQQLQHNIPNQADVAGTGRAERLPFEVRIVQDAGELEKALRIRQSAYGRHVPEFAKSLGEAEQYDYDPGSAVLLAESKLDGEPLGTMRIQTNLYAPLAMEHSVALPEWLQGGSLAEATRLGISRGRVGRLTKTALFKAYYLYCIRAGIDWMVITARSPLDRQYGLLLFQDVFPGRGFIPMQHVGNMPHRVMALKVDSVEPSWKEAEHPLYDFFFHTRHADIRVTRGTPANLEMNTGTTGLHAPRYLTN